MVFSKWWIAVSRSPTSPHSVAIWRTAIHSSALFVLLESCWITVFRTVFKCNWVDSLSTNAKSLHDNNSTGSPVSLVSSDSSSNWPHSDSANITFNVNWNSVFPTPTRWMTWSPLLTALMSTVRTSNPSRKKLWFCSKWCRGSLNNVSSTYTHLWTYHGTLPMKLTRNANSSK